MWAAWSATHVREIVIAVLCLAALACGAKTSLEVGPAHEFEHDCAAMGGRCQSPDLPCSFDEEWAGYDECGDLDNSSCCVPGVPDAGTDS